MALSDKIADLMSRCIGCGSCESVCPSFRHGGCDPRAVMAGEDGNILSCIGCGACSRRCENTDPTYVMLYSRSVALNAKVPDIFLRTGFVMPVSDLSRSNLVPEWSDEYVPLMTGCTVEAKAPFLVYSAISSAKALGEGFSQLPKNSCCMYPMPFRQMSDEARDDHKHSIGESADGDEIITLCAGCEAELRRSDVNARHIVRYYADRLDKIKALKGVDLKVALEPGCHGPEIMEEFVSVIQATGAKTIGNEMGCCGKAIPQISEKLMEERQAEIEGADAVIVACPMCFTRYDLVKGGVPVLFITELVALAAGDYSTLKYHNIKFDI